SSDLAEHRAVREAAGQFDLSHMGEIEVTGAEAAQALDYALVGNLSALKVGRARYTLLCAADGGVLDDLVVYRLSERRYLVVANAGNTAVVVEALRERAATFDAEVTDVRPQAALIPVPGPASAATVERVPGAAPAALGR